VERGRALRTLDGEPCRYAERRGLHTTSARLTCDGGHFSAGGAIASAVDRVSGTQLAARVGAGGGARYERLGASIRDLEQGGGGEAPRTPAAAVASEFGEGARRPFGVAADAARDGGAEWRKMHGTPDVAGR
jgi:hypothetical protein